MGAIRMYFKKGKDCWEYGYLTVNVWMATSFISALKGDSQEVFNYFKKTGGEELLKRFDSGEATFSYEQSLIFFQATDLISKIIVSNDTELRRLLFSYVQLSFKRFNSLDEFENYYLDYSTGMLDVVRREFEKEPGLRGKLDRLLGIEVQ